MHARQIEALQAELAERRDQCRAFLEHNPRPTWVYALDSLSILDVNEVALQAYGWGRDEFLSMTLADIRPRDDVPALMANVDRLRGLACGITGPWRHRHRDGTVVDVIISFVSIPFHGRAARLVTADPAHASRATCDPVGLSRLSPREREVFCLVAHGHTNQEIAERLGLSCKSVETYRARFMMKLSLETRADLVRCAIAHGILVD